MTTGAPDAIRPADPDRIATQQDFGEELSRLKEHADLTVRQIAKAVCTPHSTIGDYFAGRHLPPSMELLESVLTTCGETDASNIRRWKAALQRARRAPGPRPATAIAPYKGLEPFQPEDAEWYFGRDELTHSLLDLVADEDSGLPLMIVGPSGSGKSSLLRAGLIPALRATRPTPADNPDCLLPLLTPGAAPLETLAKCLPPAGNVTDSAEALRTAPRAWADLAKRGDSLPAAIIVDQFEEVWTSCPDERERLRFIAALSALAESSTVVLGLRADFYGQALRHPELAEALQCRQVVVGPLSEGQVRRVICEPARRAKLTVDDGLVELLLRDLAPRSGSPATDSAHEPGALPLLSHALLSTWKHSRGPRLTVADYRAAGGIHNAISQTAETVYQGLGAEAQESARLLFLRLVHVTGEMTETRCPLPLTRLDVTAADGNSPVRDVLGRFVEHRLITVTDEVAEISHEAVLNAWPRLRKWIVENRDDLRIRRRIEEGTRVWQDANHEDAALMRGGQLVIARDWIADPANRESLGIEAREFVDAGINHDQSERDAQRRSRLRLQRLVAALTVLVLLTAGATAYAWKQRQTANSDRNVADSRELAIEASQLRGQDVSLAAQLSLASLQAARTPAAVASVLDSAATPAAARIIDSSSVVEAVAVSPNHKVLAAAGADGTLRLWDIAHPNRPVPVGRFLERRSRNSLFTVAFSPSGLLLAAAGASRTVRVWNVGDPMRPRAEGAPLTGPSGTVFSISFSPTGHMLAAGSADGSVHRWDLSNPMRPQPLPALPGAQGSIQSVQFSPNGQVIAAGSADNDIQLWNVADVQRPFKFPTPLAGPTSAVTAVAFSPAGTTLAASSKDDNVWLWNVANPAKPADRRELTGFADWAYAVAFSPDGSTLAAGSSDDTIRLWNVTTGELTAVLPHPGVVTSLAWDGNKTLVSGVADGTVRLWHLPTPVLYADVIPGAPGIGVNGVAYSPDKPLLAAASEDLELWDTATDTRIATARVPATTFVNTVAFSPRGTMLATGTGGSLSGGYGGRVQLWSTAHGGLIPIGPSLPATQPAGKTIGAVESVAFSPNGRILATGADDGTIRLWGIADPSHPVLLAERNDSKQNIVFSVDFSPNGKILAAASGDDLTRLWNVSQPAHPSQLGKPLGGTTNYDISVAFSPNGRILAVGSADKTARLWNVTNPAKPKSIAWPLTGPGAYVYSVTFSPTGDVLAMGSTDDTVWLYDVANPGSPSLIAELTGPAGHVYSVAFSPNGRTLAAGSGDNTIRLWDISTTAAAATVCATAGQPITQQEWNRYAPGRSYAPPCPG